jgi:hypothetical protein
MQEGPRRIGYEVCRGEVVGLDLDHGGELGDGGLDVVDLFGTLDGLGMLYLVIQWVDAR